MNRLSTCIHQFVQTIPVDDDMPNELASTLQTIYRDRAIEHTQRSIEDWLLRVSQTYGVDCEWLEDDWEQYNKFVDGGKRTSYRMEEDDDQQGDEEDENQDENEDEMDTTYPVEKRSKTNSVFQRSLTTSTTYNSSLENCAVEKKRMVKIVTRWNATLGRFVHLETGMVFVSKEEPKVFAHWDGENLYRLTPDDLEVCRLYRFQVAPSRFDEEFTQPAHAAAESSFALGQS